MNSGQFKSESVEDENNSIELILPKILEEDDNIKKKLFKDIKPSLNNPIFLDVYNNLSEEYVDSEAIDIRYNINNEQELLIKFFRLSDDKSEWISIKDERINSNIKKIPDYLSWKSKLKKNDIIIYKNHLSIIKEIKPMGTFIGEKNFEMEIEIITPFFLDDIVSVEINTRNYVGKIKEISTKCNQIFYKCEFDMYAVKNLVDNDIRITHRSEFLQDDLDGFYLNNQDYFKKIKILKRNNDFKHSKNFNDEILTNNRQIKQFTFSNIHMFPDINQQFDFYSYISPKLTEYLSKKSKLKFSIVIMEIFMLYSGDGISLTKNDFEDFYVKILKNYLILTLFQRKHLNILFEEQMLLFSSEYTFSFDKFLNFIFSLSVYKCKEGCDCCNNYISNMIGEEECDCCENYICYMSIFKIITNVFKYDYFLEKKKKNKFLYFQKNYYFISNVIIIDITKKIDNIERTLYYLNNKKYYVDNFNKKIKGFPILKLFWNFIIDKQIKNKKSFSIYNLMIYYPNKIKHLLYDISVFIKKYDSKKYSIPPTNDFLYSNAINEYIKNIKYNCFSTNLKNGQFFFLVKKDFINLYKKTKDDINLILKKIYEKEKKKYGYYYSKVPLEHFKMNNILVNKINKFYSLFKKKYIKKKNW